MTWSQTNPPTGAAKITVTIEVEGYPEEANRQLATFVTDLIRKGATLKGYDDVNGMRVLAMEAHSGNISTR